MKSKHFSLIYTPLSYEMDEIDEKIESILSIRRNKILEPLGILNDFEKKTDNLQMGLVSIASVIKEKGWSVSYHHPANSWQNNGNQELNCLAHQSSVIGFHTLTSNFPTAISMLKTIKRINSSTVVVVGGPHVSYEWRDAIESGFDYVFLGEAEESIREFIDQMDKYGTVKDIIPGVISGRFLSTYNREGNLQKTFLRRICSSKSWPIPAFDVVPQAIIEKSWVGFHTGRGCSNRCAFCAESAFFRKWRGVGSEWLIEALELLRSLSKDRVAFIGDSNFLSDNEHAQKIIGVLKYYHKKHGMYWRIMVRADHLTSDWSDQLMESGVVDVFVGVESTVDEVLRKSGKGTDYKRMLSGLKHIKGKIPIIRIGLIMGLPGQKREHLDKLKDDIDYLIEEGLSNDITIRRLIPYPGSLIYRKPKNFEMIIDLKDWSNYSRRGNLGGSAIHLLSYDHEEKEKDFENIRNYLLKKFLE